MDNNATAIPPGLAGRPMIESRWVPQGKVLIAVDPAGREAGTLVLPLLGFWQMSHGGRYPFECRYSVGMRELYRHLKFSAPDTNIYRFDLITWPGYLVICGDVQEWMFTRVRDMFTFFRLDKDRTINPDYWAEKLRPGGTRSAMVFSRDAYQQRVDEWIRQKYEELEMPPLPASEFQREVHEKLAISGETDERRCHELLMEFEHDGIRISDSWEWEFREFDSHFLWACFAITWGIEQYDKKKTPPF